MQLPAYKRCPDCQQQLPLDAFTSDKRRKDGLSFYCRNCARIRLRISHDKRRGGPPRHRYPRDIDVPAGCKWCPDCDQVLPNEEFSRNRNTKTGLNTYCKPCHNARSRASLGTVGGSRTYHLKRRYGITAEDADRMLAEQDGLCDICERRPAVHVDHDHATGKVRGLLCFNCNAGLGHFRDDADVMTLALGYLQWHGTQSESA